MLKKAGIPKENILYINFEDNKLIGADSNDLEKLLEAYFELYNIDKNKNKVYGNKSNISGRSI